MSMYSHIHQEWAKPEKSIVKKEMVNRMIQWRRQPTVVRVAKPLRLDRARALGYKAKQGIVVVRVKVRRGHMISRLRPKAGRKPTKMGVSKWTLNKSLQVVAEQRAQKHYPNMEVLNSYWVGQDGHHKFFEIILVDPVHPSIINDKDLNWICQSTMQGRVYRGKTSAGRKGRGLRHKGIGAEKMRPSLAKHGK